MSDKIEEDVLISIDCSILKSNDDMNKCEAIGEEYKEGKIDMLGTIIRMEKSIGGDKLVDVISVSDETGTSEIE